MHFTSTYPDFNNIYYCQKIIIELLKIVICPSVNVFTKGKRDAGCTRGEADDLYVSTLLAWEFVSEVCASIQCGAKLEKKIFGIILMLDSALSSRLLFFICRCLPPLQLWCIFMCAVGVLHQLFVPVYFQINSVCKSIHACNYCRLRYRSMDPP